MTDTPEKPTTAELMLGPNYQEAPGVGSDPTAYRQVADPRYMAALAQQKAAKAKLTPRRRPVLRLVVDNG